MVPARRSERTFGKPDCGSKPLRRRQVLPGDRPGRHCREQHIASGRIETPGQSIEHGYRPRRFGAVGVMLVPAPGIIRDGPGVPDRAGSFLQLAGRNPACRFNHFWRIFAAQRGVAVEDRPAGNRTVSGRDGVFASQGETLGACIVAAGRRIITDGAVGFQIPGDKLSRAAGNQVLCPEQPVGIGAHQKRSIAPRADERLVEPSALDHDVGQTQRECTVGSRAHPQPDIGFVGKPGVARVDHDQLHSAFQARDRRGRVRDARKRWIIAPQDKASGLGNVCHRAAATSGRNAADAEDEARRKAASPAAQLERRHHVRCAECIHQSGNESSGIRDGGRRRGR